MGAHHWADSASGEETCWDAVPIPVPLWATEKIPVIWVILICLKKKKVINCDDFTACKPVKRKLVLWIRWGFQGH